MKKDFKYSINQGLPGGANELKKFVQGSISITGYKSDSPDVNNDFNIIPSNRITMQGVNFPVLGVDDFGYEQMMMPGGEYSFPGNYVTEIPQMGKGGLTQWFAEEWTDVKTGKKCGRSGKEKGSRPYPACRPKKRVNETTPKTTSEMSAAEKAKFKREKTSGKRINYNHKRKEFGGETGWLDQYQDGGWYTEAQWDAAVNQAALDSLPKFTQNRISNPGLIFSAPQSGGLGYSMNPSINKQRPGSSQNTSQPKPIEQPRQLEEIDLTEEIKGLKDQWYTTQEWDDAMPDSTFENLVEFIDPTGITSYDDARVAYRDWKRSGTTMPSFGQGLEMFGAVPGLGKLSKLKYLANSKALKPLYKYFPWQQTLNAADTVQDEYEKKHGGWLNKYQEGGETSTEQNPSRIAPVNIKAEDNIFKKALRGYSKFKTGLFKTMAKNPAILNSYLNIGEVLDKTGNIISKSTGTLLPKQFIFDEFRPVDYPLNNPLLLTIDAALRVAGKNALPIKDASGNYVPGEEIYRKILGFNDSSYNYIEKSPYKPSKVKDGEKSEYIKFKNLYNPQKLINAYVKAQKTLPEGKTSTVIPSLDPYIINRESLEASGLAFSQQDPLQNFTLDKGEDEKGKYISLYDIYDFTGPANNLIYGFRKPIEIYDRMYYEKDKSGRPVYKKKYGGWLDSYQDGGELPELNSKMDVANFYKNPLSEKYGIAQNPDTGSFEYYLKSGQSSDPIKQEVEELESQNLRKAYVSSLSEEVSRMSDVVLPEVKQQQSRSRNIEKTYELERQKDFIDSQLYNQPIGPQLDPTSLPIPSYSGMNPIQEYYANLLYDQYGKFVVTDKGENKTFYGTKTKDGDWDVNSFEVLTGRASDPRYQQVLKEELAQRRNDQYGITPIGVFPLSKKPNYYGSPGFKVEGSSLNPKVTVAYHTVFNPEKRLSLFENEDLADNYASSGCINCKKPNLEALINFVGQNGLSATIDSRLPLDKNIEWTKKNTPKYKKWLDNYK